MVRWQRETVCTCCALKPFWVKSDHQQFQRSAWDIMRQYNGLCLHWWVQGDCAPFAVATTPVCVKCKTLDVRHRKPSFALSAIFAARLAPCLCCGCRAFRCVELTTCCKAQTEPILLRGGIRLPTCWCIQRVHVLPQLFPRLGCCAWNWAGVWSYSYHPGQGFAGQSQFNVL